MQSLLPLPRCYAPNVNLKETSLGVFLDVDIDGKVGVDISHLVFEAPRHADDEIVDDGLDGAQRSHALARSMM